MIINNSDLLKYYTNKIKLVCVAKINQISQIKLPKARRGRREGRVWQLSLKTNWVVCAKFKEGGGGFLKII